MLLRAFAKINLGLQIVGKRPDGYHELQTVLQAIDWFDEIRLDMAEHFQFSASEGPQDETNLVVRAIRAFEAITGLTAKVRVRLEKNIPSGAGLGGGSADAAVTFLGLQKIYGRAVSAADQFRALRSIGSDVPFFVLGGRAFGSGRGDEVQPLVDETDYWLALVNPAIPIATAEAYSWLTVPGKFNSIEGFRAQFLSGSGYAELMNDFETPVFARYPQLREIRDELLRSGAFGAALSGSGSVVFGRFHREANAREAASVLGRRYSVKVARPLSRAEYSLRMMD